MTCDACKILRAVFIENVFVNNAVDGELDWSTTKKLSFYFTSKCVPVPWVLSLNLGHVDNDNKWQLFIYVVSRVLDYESNEYVWEQKTPFILHWHPWGRQSAVIRWLIGTETRIVL